MGIEKTKEIRNFICPVCFYEQIIIYFVGESEPPDRHECDSCKEVYWWSHNHKTLYKEQTHEVIPEDYFQIIKSEKVTLD